jgi:hypothetical protein
VAEAKEEDAGSKMGGQEFAPAVSKKHGEAVNAVHERVFRKPAEAKALATAMLRRSSLAFVQAEATAQGSPDLRPGFVVELKAVGPVFTGTYYITRAVHDYLPAGFTSRLFLRRTSIKLPPQPVQGEPPPPVEQPAQKELAEKIAEITKQEEHFIDVKVVDPDGNPIVNEKARIASDVEKARDISLGEQGVHVPRIPPGERKVLLPDFFLPLEPPKGDPIPVEPPKTPRLHDAQWDRTRAACGTEVKLRVGCQDIPDGTTIVFRIYRSDALSPEDLAAFVEAKVKGPIVEVPWTFAPPPPGPDDPFRPARFYFLVQAGDARSRSGTIEFTDTISFEARTKRGAPAAGQRFRLKFPSGEELESKFDAAGKAKFAEVPPGRYEIILL